MKRRLTLISLLILSSICVLRSQVSLVSTDSIACDSMNAWIFFEPSEAYDTISEVSWTVNGEAVSADDSLNLILKNPGTYSVLASINSGQTLALEQDLHVYPSPEVDFSYSDTSSGPDYTYVFRSSGPGIDSLEYNYSWLIDGEDAGNTPVVLYTFEDAGEFAVGLRVENNKGCSNYLMKDILVVELLECPNVFTPNMDGHNDYFIVATDGNTIYDFRVYAKTGLKVYHTESPAIFWDGRSLSGIEMQPGIYYYTIEALNTTSPEEISGFVHLFR